MENPVVLIFSHGKSITAENVVSNIRKLESSEKQTDVAGKTGFIYPISTKYYNTEIVLLPLQDLSDIPFAIKERIEGILIYFDAEDRSFLEIIPKYVDFIKSNDVEFNVLLCDILDDKKGIQFKELKECHKTLDVIELGRQLEEDEEEDPYNPLGYDELAQALRSVIWSNVNVNGGRATSQLDENLSSPDQQEDLSEQSIENELENFEKLLTHVMQFRPNTENMNRNERLNYAQQFAVAFERLIMADEDDEPPPEAGAK